MQVDSFEVLSLLAELAVGLVGFSGIVVAMQKGRRNVGLMYMLYTAVVLALLSILPFVLLGLGLGESLVWAVLSTLAALYLIGMNRIAFRTVPDQAKGALYRLFVGGFYVFAVVGIVNALIWHSFAAYLALLSWFFVYVLVLFVRLISDLSGSTPERDTQRAREPAE